jgi:predicted MPP superfamily phosphohydrolase
MSIGRILFAISIVVLIVGGGHYFIWARLVRDAALPEPWFAIATLALVALAVLVPVGMLLTRLAPSVGHVLAYPLFIWMGAFFWLFLAAIALQVARVALHVGDVDPVRRLFLSRVLAGGTALVVIGMTAFAVRRGLSALQVKRVKISLRRLPAALDGMTVVQLSDIHVGPTIGRAFIAEMVRKTNALSPDIVVITGDLVDGSVAELGDAVAPLAELRARYGVFFVTGNHEYYSGAEEWMAEVERLGIRVLRNERVEVGPAGATIDLAGIFDWSGGQFSPSHKPDLPRALAGRDDSRELILLAHQPRAVLEAAAHGVGLQLSGHTHGGQIWPWGYFVALQQRWVQGLFREKDTQLYVSAGTGYWGPPMRLGTRAEITQLTLQRATTNNT